MTAGTLSTSTTAYRTKPTVHNLASERSVRGEGSGRRAAKTRRDDACSVR